MVQKIKILKYIDEYLKISDFADYCVNGLQVEGKEEISKIALGVTASKRLFEKANENGADMVMVHHGLFWKREKPLAVVSWLKERLEVLIKNDMNLVAYHLPLDAHPDVGNNARLIEILDLEKTDKFDVGFFAKPKKKIKVDAFIDKINKKLDITSIAFPFGSNIIDKVLVVSGGSGQLFEDAKKNGAGTFITGSLGEGMIRISEEIGLNLINIGHYNSEKYGIQALGELLTREFGVSVEFIDIPNII
jgi:dinuclear metal center YbgI/SA1388 family protein